MLISFITVPDGRYPLSLFSDTWRSSIEVKLWMHSGILPTIEFSERYKLARLLKPHRPATKEKR